MSSSFSADFTKHFIHKTRHTEKINRILAQLENLAVYFKKMKFTYFLPKISKYSFLNTIKSMVKGIVVIRSSCYPSLRFAYFQTLGDVFTNTIISPKLKNQCEIYVYIQNMQKNKFVFFF